MRLKDKVVLQFNNINLSFDGQNILDDVSGVLKEGDKVGLVGANGSGKTSLLNILSSNLKPNSGSISSNCRVAYVPQLNLDSYNSKRPLYQYVEKHFSQWWEVFSFYEKMFAKEISPNALVKNLSGGEIVKINFSLALAKNPALLLLDEPTNHLDLSSLRELQKILNNLEIPFVVVSHDVEFLNNVVKKIWEIENCAINIYGGNYDFYKEEKRKKEQSKRNRSEVLKKKIKKEEMALQKVKVENQKKQSKFKKASSKNDRSLPRLTRGERKLKAQKNFGSEKIKRDEAISKLSENLKDLNTQKRKDIYLELKNQAKTGLVLSIEKGSLVLPSERVLIEDINIKIYHGDRFAILGDNGEGKTTFVKQLDYLKQDLLKGEIKYSQPYKTLFVDQKYDLVNPDLSLLDNIFNFNPAISYENARRLLGNMGFVKELEVKKLAKELSGGETAKLAFAMVTVSDVDVLVLDEPTNNLDIQVLELISESIKNFKGTIIVVSHNMNFLKNIGINRYYEIKSNRLKQCQNI